MNTRNFNKKTGAALLALVLMALLPLGGLAVTASLPEYGLTVPFPGSLDVFTQQMDPGDPLLKLYGKTAGQVAEELRAAGTIALAYDIAGAFTITLTASSGSFEDYGSMEEEGLLAQAAALGGSEYELIETAQGTALLVKADSGHQAVARLQAGGLAVELRLAAGGRIRSGMLSTLKGIIKRVEISQGQ